MISKVTYRIARKRLLYWSFCELRDGGTRRKHYQRQLAEMRKLTRVNAPEAQI